MIRAQHLRHGAKAERLAKRYLIQQGFRAIADNTRFKFGELDLVMLDPKQQTVVVVEVRYKKNADHEQALASIDAAKQKRIRLAANAFLSNHPDWRDHPYRFDIITIVGALRTNDIQWLPDAFYDESGWD